MRLTFMATVPFTVLLYVLAAPTVTLIYNAPKAELATQLQRSLSSSLVYTK